LVSVAFFGIYRYMLAIGLVTPQLAIATAAALLTLAWLDAIGGSRGVWILRYWWGGYRAGNGRFSIYLPLPW
jgi:hypothetical protein